MYNKFQGFVGKDSARPFSFSIISPSVFLLVEEDKKKIIIDLSNVWAESSKAHLNFNSLARLNFQHF